MNEVIKYPLPCGCAGPKYISKCARHQNEDMEAQAQQMGIPDIVCKAAELHTTPVLNRIFEKARTSVVIVKVLPDE